MTDNLSALVRVLFESMSPLQRALHFREQAICFAYGNLHVTNHRADLAFVARHYDERHGVFHGDLAYLANTEYQGAVQRWRDRDGKTPCPCQQCGIRRSCIVLADALKAGGAA